jgi:hypothetical protein
MVDCRLAGLNDCTGPALLDEFWVNFWYVSYDATNLEHSRRKHTRDLDPKYIEVSVGQSPIICSYMYVYM